MQHMWCQRNTRRFKTCLCTVLAPSICLPDIITAAELTLSINDVLTQFSQQSCKNYHHFPHFKLRSNWGTETMKHKIMKKKGFKLLKFTTCDNIQIGFHLKTWKLVICYHDIKEKLQQYFYWKHRTQKMQVNYFNVGTSKNLLLTEC